MLKEDLKTVTCVSTGGHVTDQPGANDVMCALYQTPSGVTIRHTNSFINCAPTGHSYRFFGTAGYFESIEELRLIEEDGKAPKKKEQPKIKSSVNVERSNQFKSEIDLRGMIGDEAWFAVDKYLDDAIMYNMQTVHLIHGKGTGALKNALWKFLKGDKRIASFRLGRYGEGDGGVTVVELK